MTFLNPMLAAVGLGCIAVPIIIHILMRRKRRPVQWAAMKFLLEAYRRQRRRMNLEQILLLASRCALVALLALALGKPVLGAAGLLSRGPRTLYLLFDNSLASDATSAASDAKPSIERSRAAALDLISKLDQGQGDRVGIVTLASPTESAVLPPTPDLSAAVELIKGLRPTDSRADIPAALAKVRDELARAPSGAQNEGVWVALVSDLRAGSADLEASPGGSLTPAGQVASRLIAMSPADAPLGNVAITAVEPTRSIVLPDSERPAGQTATVSTAVRVSLRRSGPGVADAASTKVRVDASIVGPTRPARPPASEVVALWRAGQDTTTADLMVEVPIPDAARGGRQPVVLVAIIDRDAIAGDNTFYCPVDTRDRLEVALLVPGRVSSSTGVETFTAADWMAVSLSPDADLTRRRQSGEVRVTALDPARALLPTPGRPGSLGVLGDFDAILIPRPDAIDAAGWKMVRGAMDLGALVVVAPPADAQTHTWADPMIEALGVDWKVGRESRAFTPAATLAEDRPAASFDLLSAIAAELPDLVSHVTVSRIVPIEGPAESFDTLLRMQDASPFLVVGQAGAGASSGPGHSAASRGLLVLFAAAPDLRWTDLPAKPLMVPLMQELVRQGVGRAMGRRTAVAGAAPALPQGVTELAPVEVGDPQPDRPTPSAIPVDPTGRLASPIRFAGVWNARSSAGNSLGVIGCNADPAAGLVDVRTRDELVRWLGPVFTDVTWLEGGEASALDAGAGASAEAALARESRIPPISIPLLAAALGMALLEACFARWFSHAKAEPLVGAGLTKDAVAPALPTTGAQPA